MDRENSTVFKVHIFDNDQSVVISTCGMFWSSGECNKMIENFLESGFEELLPEAGELHFLYTPAVIGDDIYLH